MNNYIILILNILAQAGVFTEKEAEELSKEFEQSTLPDNFAASHRVVKEIFDDLEIPKKVALKEELEDKIHELEIVINHLQENKK